MGDHAWPPLPGPLSPDVEALLAYERTIDRDLDLVRARALVRARETLGETILRPATQPSLWALPRTPLGLTVGTLVAAGVATAIEIFVSSGARRSIADSEARSVSSVDLSSAVEASHPVVAQAARDTMAPPPVQLSPASVAARALVIPEEGLDELRLLERARLYDRRREYDSVLTSTREHERRFAKGRLSEERDVLQIKALIGLHRAHEARQTAALFRREFPRSVLLGSIDRLLASLP